MKKLLSAVVVIGLSMPVVALAESWDNVPLIDKSCGAKFKANPDEHPAACLKKCAKGGEVGIITSDGTWLKLDKAGVQKAVAAIDKTEKKDHIRANVTGDKNGDVIAVKDLKLVD